MEAPSFRSFEHRMGESLDSHQRKQARVGRLWAMYVSSWSSQSYQAKINISSILHYHRVLHTNVLILENVCTSQSQRHFYQNTFAALYWDLFSELTSFLICGWMDVNHAEEWERVLKLSFSLCRSLFQHVHVLSSVLRTLKLVSMDVKNFTTVITAKGYLSRK